MFTVASSISLSGTRFSEVTECKATFLGSNIRKLDLKNTNFSRLSEMNRVFDKSNIDTLELSGIQLSDCITVSGSIFGVVKKLIVNNTDLSKFDFRMNVSDLWGELTNFNVECVGEISMINCNISNELLDKFYEVIECASIVTNMRNIVEWCNSKLIMCEISDEI